MNVMKDGGSSFAVWLGWEAEVAGRTPQEARPGRAPHRDGCSVIYQYMYDGAGSQAGGV